MLHYQNWLSGIVYQALPVSLLMIISLVLGTMSILFMFYYYDPIQIFILGIGILGLVLGYLLFRWAKRNLPEIRMPNWFYDRRARLFLGLVLGLLAILLAGF